MTRLRTSPTRRSTVLGYPIRSVSSIDTHIAVGIAISIAISILIGRSVGQWSQQCTICMCICGMAYAKWSVAEQIGGLCPWRRIGLGVRIYNVCMTGDFDFLCLDDKKEDL